MSPVCEDKSSRNRLSSWEGATVSQHIVFLLCVIYYVAQVLTLSLRVTDDQKNANKYSLHCNHSTQVSSSKCLNEMNKLLSFYMMEVHPTPTKLKLL